MARTAYRLEANEKEIIDGFANKIGLFGGGGGKLVLTDRRLIFTNRRKTEIQAEYLLENLLHVGVASSATIWSIVLIFTVFMTNAIRVTTTGGVSQRFVVNQKNRWVDLIAEYRSKAKV